MRALSHVYSSMSSWKLVEVNQTYELYECKGSIFLAYLVSSVTLIAIGVFLLISKRESIPSFASYLVFSISISLVLFGIFHSRSIKQSKLIFSYDSMDGIAKFANGSIEIDDALNRLAFSYEVHRGTSNYPNSELNIVVDGSRRRFLASRGENITLEKVTKKIESLGFNVTRYRHPDV